MNEQWMNNEWIMNGEHNEWTTNEHNEQTMDNNKNLLQKVSQLKV